MLLFTLPGMVVIYAGDEIGLRDVEIPSGEARDPFERRVPGYGLNRDPHRTPMRWNTSPQAGFTTGEPWLPIGSDIETCNVEAQRCDAGSLLHLYRSLVALRRSESVLQAGSYELLGRIGEVLVCRRRLGDYASLVALNFGHAPQDVQMSHHGMIRLSTALDRVNETVAGTVHLRAHEGVILECRRAS
jgi:alpha-glucosidase